MPIAETPLEQLDEALAIKCTGEPDVLPLVGELMETPATAGSANIAHRHTATETFPTFIANLQQFFFKSRCEEQLSCLG